MLEQKDKPTIVDVNNVSRIFNYNGKHTTAVNNISLSTWARSVGNFEGAIFS